MTDFAYMTIARAGELIRTKKLSPVELTQALLARIEKLNPRLNAFIRPTPDIALAGARAAETQIMAGDWRGPLHGVPYGLKDIIDYAGLPTTAHSKILVDNMATADAVVTRALKAAGGVMMGKLATHEFAIGGPSFDLPWPPAVNPWGNDGRRYHPGGSSSGSGSALASGMLPAALGTDTGGSVRNPASMCGIVGMKPTYGYVSRRGVLPLSVSLDHVGPMTRTVRDNAILLDIIAGHDPLDAASADVTRRDTTADLDKGVRGLVIGLVRHFYTEDDVGHPDQVKAVDDAAEVFRKLGAEVREIRLPSNADFVTCNRLILRAEAFSVHRQWLAERPGDYGEYGRQRIMDGATITAADYIDAQRLRTRLIDRTLAAMADCDVVLTASSLDPSCPIDDTAEVLRTYPRQVRQPFNVTGQPALVVPAGFTKNELPLSIQLVGHPFQEAMVYRVGAAYEAATTWSTRRPSGL
jgi:aspartyl-tRNA(Asn)/glutamyl-tRNA(Gln) amidotransferase subunit A